MIIFFVLKIKKMQVFIPSLYEFLGKLGIMVLIPIEVGEHVPN